jgi:site-specific DNA-cytosine methylase
VRIVSLFSGIGGLDIACERAFNGTTITQVEREPFAVRVLERRWPDAVRHDDVTTYRGEPCDVVCGGFPCTDLSVAGKREGLDAARSGLYHEMIRIVSESQPQYVVFENVPPLLKYRGRVDTDLARIGYGTIWQVCEASDVGAPHRRQRVFVVAVRGLAGSQMLPRPSPQGDLFAPAFGAVQAAALWPTPTTGDHATMYQQGKEPLGHAARWPTPMASDASRGSETMMGGNQTLLGSARWPTPTAGDAKNRGYQNSAAGVFLALPGAVGGASVPWDRMSEQDRALLRHAKAWPTPAARDYKDSGHEPSAQRRNSPCLPASAVMDADQAPGVLNPAWVELLMGLPTGWTDPTAEPGVHVWPAGRGEEQHASEPPRLVPPKTVANRSARLKALGNAVVWQQAEAAIRRALEVA